MQVQVDCTALYNLYRSACLGHVHMSCFLKRDPAFSEFGCGYRRIQHHVGGALHCWDLELNLFIHYLWSTSRQHGCTQARVTIMISWNDKQINSLHSFGDKRIYIHTFHIKHLHCCLWLNLFGSFKGKVCGIFTQKHSEITCLSVNSWRSGGVWQCLRPCLLTVFSLFLSILILECHL